MSLIPSEAVDPISKMNDLADDSNQSILKMSTHGKFEG